MCVFVGLFVEVKGTFEVKKTSDLDFHEKSFYDVSEGREHGFEVHSVGDQ